MIDTHAHLLMYDERKNNFKCDSSTANYTTKDIINNMEQDNLQSIVTIGTNIEDSIASVEFAQKHDNIYAAVGIYPTYSTSYTDDDLEQIKKLAQNEKVVAIGEIGLDYHTTEDVVVNGELYEKYDAPTQKELFVKQLKIADELKLPFCIHCRDAASDMYDVLSENKHLINNFGLMHCYSEGSAWYKKFLDLGLYLSFSGNITYTKADRSFLKDVPLDRILVETDCPYLAPQGERGKPNEPKNVKKVIQKIAEEIGIDEEELDKITTENARRFYRIK